MSSTRPIAASRRDRAEEALPAAFPPGRRANVAVMAKRALLVGLAVVLTLLAGIIAHPLSAQTARETAPMAPSDTPPQARTETSPPTVHGLPKAYRRGSALPKTPAEREKMLSDLYALLATAEDENSAKAVSYTHLTLPRRG